MGKNKYFIQDGMISKFDFMDNQEFYPLTTLCSLLNNQDEQYEKLAKKFVIVSKALELACGELFWLVWNGQKEITKDEYVAHHINVVTKKAKEMVENE